MDVKDYKIAVVGAGPMGGILGAFLAQKNVDVTLVDIWKEHMDAIREKGLTIGGVETLTSQFTTDHLITSISDLKDIKLDLVFIATKASVLEPVVNELKMVIPENTFVVSYQNGIGNEEFLAKVFGDERVFRVIINYAGNIIEPGKVDMTFFNPPNVIGSVSPKNHVLAKSIAELMSETGLITEFQEDIKPAEWKKAILNAALGSLCAITRATMREAMDFPDTRAIVSDTLKEGLAVAEAIGITFEADFHDKCIAYLSKGGHHKPSTLIDVENRKQTEISFLNEKIAEIGKKHNVPVPVNQAITALVKIIDAFNKRDQQYINTKVKEMGLEDRCVDCYYAKDCIDVFHCCPFSGEVIPSKTVP
ncbi:MAG: ketopantoate reductase family protein [Promethearchaeota archaeon]